MWSTRKPPPGNRSERRFLQVLGPFLPAPESPPGRREVATHCSGLPARVGSPLRPPRPRSRNQCPPRRRRAEPRTRRAAFPREARRSVQGTEGPSRREDGGHGHEAPRAGRIPPAYTSFSCRPHFTDEETEQIRSRGASGSRREPGGRREFRGFQEPGADRLSFADPRTRGDASVQGHRRVRPGSAGPVWPRGLAPSLLSLF